MADESERRIRFVSEWQFDLSIVIQRDLFFYVILFDQVLKACFVVTWWYSATKLGVPKSRANA